jgi:hypothetical protein
MGIIEGGMNIALETAALAVETVESSFQRASGADSLGRLDSSLPQGTPEVLIYPLDLETATDSGLLVDFQIWLKESSHIQSHIRKLKPAGLGNQQADASTYKEAVKKKITARNTGWGSISDEAKKTSMKNMEEFFTALKNDPSATMEDGTFAAPYQAILDLSEQEQAEFFQRMESGTFAKMSEQNRNIHESQQKAAAGNRAVAAAAKAQREAELNPSKEQTSRLAASDIEPTGEVIRMYLPGGIAFSDTVNYEGVNLGIIKNLLEGNFASTIAAKALQGVASVADGASNVLGGELNVGSGIAALSGAVQNNKVEQLFKGQEIRTFTFQFTFRPRNADEANAMIRIIKMFRFHMRPELGPGGAYYLTPSEFKIRFYSIVRGNASSYNQSEFKKRKVIATGAFDSNGSQTILTENTFLPRIKQCALQSISMNPMPDDIMETFSDPHHHDTPVAVTIDLTFTEKEEINRKDVKDGF